MRAILFPLRVSRNALYNCCCCRCWGKCRRRCGATPSSPADLFLGARRHPMNSYKEGSLVFRVCLLVCF